MLCTSTAWIDSTGVNEYQMNVWNNTTNMPLSPPTGLKKSKTQLIELLIVIKCLYERLREVELHAQGTPWGEKALDLLILKEKLLKYKLCLDLNLWL